MAIAINTAIFMAIAINTGGINGGFSISITTARRRRSDSAHTHTQPTQLKLLERGLKPIQPLTSGIQDGPAASCSVYPGE